MTNSSRLSPKAIAFWPVVVLIAAGDFVTKRLAESALTLHVPQTVLGDWIRLTLTYNTGAAMNLSLGTWDRWFLSAIAVGMLGVLYWMYRGAGRSDAWQALAIGLVAGGALGNLLDRIRSARGVVDFIDVGTAGWRFWTFNVADAGVSLGAVLLAMVLWRKPNPAEAPAGGTGAAATGSPLGAAEVPKPAP